MKNPYSFSFFPLLLFLPPFPLFLGMLAVVVDDYGCRLAGVGAVCKLGVDARRKTKIQQRLRGVDDGLGWGSRTAGALEHWSNLWRVLGIGLSHARRETKARRFGIVDVVERGWAPCRAKWAKRGGSDLVLTNQKVQSAGKKVQLSHGGFPQFLGCCIIIA